MAPKAYAEIVLRNARRWEAMAKHRPGMSLAEHRAGVSALDPEELELLGDLHGKRVLHLACSTCDEGITMATRGAHVVGIDITLSPVPNRHASRYHLLTSTLRTTPGDSTK